MLYPKISKQNKRKLKDRIVNSVDNIIDVIIENLEYLINNKGSLLEVILIRFHI